MQFFYRKQNSNNQTVTSKSIPSSKYRWRNNSENIRWSGISDQNNGDKSNGKEMNKTSTSKWGKILKSDKISARIKWKLKNDCRFKFSKEELLLNYIS